MVIRDSAVGAMTTAPTPCAARAASSHACVVTKPPSSEANENRTIPAMKTRLDAGVVMGVSPGVRVLCRHGRWCGGGGRGGFGVRGAGQVGAADPDHGG